MSQFPPGPQAGKCKDRCQATLNQKTSEWALAGKLCKTGSCDGISKLGTLNSYQLDAVSYDNSQQLFCGGPPPPSALCCPSYLSANTLAPQFDNAGHNLPTPYFTALTPTHPNFLAFTNAVNAQLMLARVGTCGRNAAAIKVTYTMYNTGSVNAPTSLPAPLAGGFTGWTPVASFYATINGPVTFVPTPPGFTIPVNPNYFAVVASAQVINQAGAVIQCGDVMGACFNSQRFADIHNPTSNFKMMPGAQPPTTGAAQAPAATRVTF